MWGCVVRACNCLMQIYEYTYLIEGLWQKGVVSGEMGEPCQDICWSSDSFGQDSPNLPPSTSFLLFTSNFVVCLGFPIAWSRCTSVIAKARGLWVLWRSLMGEGFWIKLVRAHVRCGCPLPKLVHMMWWLGSSLGAFVQWWIQQGLELGLPWKTF